MLDVAGTEVPLVGVLVSSLVGEGVHWAGEAAEVEVAANQVARVAAAEEEVTTEAGWAAVEAVEVVLAPVVVRSRRHHQ